jgi:hypothetical protein
MEMKGAAEPVSPAAGPRMSGETGRLPVPETLYGSNVFSL